MKPARQTEPDGGDPARVILLLPAVLSSLPVIGERLIAFAGGTAAERGAETALHRLRLAVQEACANLIRHGRMAESERRLAVQFELLGDTVRVRISDRGEPFDPTTLDHQLPADDEPAEGGYGLFLIQALVDVVEYRSVDGTNTLTLGKLLAEEDAP